MFDYFIRFYGSYSPTHYLSTFTYALIFMLAFASFKRERRTALEIPLFLIANYIVVSLISWIYYIIAPGGDAGYLLCPPIYAGILYVLYSLHYKSFSLDRAMRGCLGIYLCVMTPALMLPIVLWESKYTFLSSYRLVSWFGLLTLTAGSTLLGRKFTTSRFKQINSFSVILFFSITVFGWALDGFAITFLEFVPGESFNYNFFMCLCLLVLEHIGFVLCYLVNKKTDEQLTIRLENERIKRELEMLKSYELGYTQVRMVKHDIEGQYAIINSLLKEGQYNEAINYFDSLKIMTAPLYQNVYSDNRTINLALNLATEQGKKYGVRFNVKAAVPKELSINDASLTSVLNNLLVNCIDATRNLENNKKDVNVAIILKDEYLTIRTSNHFDKSTLRTKKDGTLLTSKKDTKKHGYGFQIASNIAQKEGGMVTYKIDGDLFVVDAMIQGGVKQ